MEEVVQDVAIAYRIFMVYVQAKGSKLCIPADVSSVLNAV